MTTVVLTKQSSAHRLILSAIRMFDAGEDELATFVVASSAFSLLRELMLGRGESFQARIFRAAIYYDARALVDGREGRLPSEPSLQKIIKAVAAQIRAGDVQNEEDIQPVIENEWEMIRHLTKPFNFLKHASRDSEATLPEGSVDALSVIGMALAAYVSIFPAENLPPEFEAFVRRNKMLLE